MGFASVCDHHCARITKSVLYLSNARQEDLLNLSCLIGAVGIGLAHNPYLVNHGCPLRLNRGVGRSLSAKLCHILVPFPNRMVERNKFLG
jgi:hypothetical protein